MFRRNERMGRTPLRVAGMVVVGIVVATVLGLGLGALVMLLWNWLLPPIFGLKAITYLQGVGLFILSHLLFGGGHRGHYRGMRGWNGRERTTGEKSR